MEIWLCVVLGLTCISLIFIKPLTAAVGKKLVMKAIQGSLNRTGFVRRSVTLSSGATAWYLERQPRAPSDATPILVLPGATVSMDLMGFRLSRLVRGLTDRHIVVVELPHHGRNVSVDLNFSSPTDTMAGMAEYLHEVRAATMTLATPIDLLGYSLGGGLAAHYAVKYPQHLRRLLLLVPYFYETATDRFVDILDSGNWKEVHGWETYGQMVNFFHQWLGLAPADSPPRVVMRGIHAMRQDQYPSGYWSACLSALQAASPNANTFLDDHKEALAAFGQPTLVVCGSEDAVCDPHKLVRLEALFGRATCTLRTVTCGHSFGPNGTTVFEAAHDELRSFLER